MPEQVQDGGEIDGMSYDGWKMIQDVLWSDPGSQPGLVPNASRGCGGTFGDDITEQRALEESSEEGFYRLNSLVARPVSCSGVRAFTPSPP